MSKNKPYISIRDIAQIGMMIAIIEACKFALSGSPNVELTSFWLIMFTLFFGWLMIYIISESEKKLQMEALAAVRIAAAVGCAFAAEILKTDYGAYGILIIALFYFLYGQKKIYVPLVGVTLLYPLAEIPARPAPLPGSFWEMDTPSPNANPVRKYAPAS